MYRGLIFLFLLGWLSLSKPLHAQDKPGLDQVDSITYGQWQNHDWDGLIRKGKKALHAGIDFYYLRVRLGVAYYEKRNYHLAITHLEKARKMYAEEIYIQEYLYYSYLLAGNMAEAKTIAATFSTQMKQKTGTADFPFVEKIDLAYNFSGQIDRTVIDGFTADVSGQTEGFQVLPRQHHYFFLGLQHHLHPRFSWYHGYTGLLTNQLLHTRSEGNINTDTNFRTTFHQYYASGNWLVSKGISLLAGIHYLQNSYSMNVENQGQGPQSLFQVTETDKDYLTFASVHTRISYASFGAGFYYGTINNARQYQKDLKLTLFPLGNLNLYSVSVIAHQTQQSLYLESINRVVFDQLVGAKIVDGLWLEAYGTIGEMENFFLNDGIIIFNGMDKIHQRMGGRLLIVPNSRWALHLDYTHFSNESQFKPDIFADEIINEKKYSLQSFTGILSWRFY